MLEEIQIPGLEVGNADRPTQKGRQDFQIRAQLQVRAHPVPPNFPLLRTCCSCCALSFQPLRNPPSAPWITVSPVFSSMKKTTGLPRYVPSITVVALCTCSRTASPKSAPLAGL